MPSASELSVVDVDCFSTIKQCDFVLTEYGF